MIAKPLGSALPALAVALLPKCPACVAAYLAVASSIGLGKLDPGIVSAVLIGVLVIALALLGRTAARRRRWGAFAIACTGTAIVLGARAFDGGRIAMIGGVVVLYAGAAAIYLSRASRPEHACHST
ncbi:MAG TPA: hypothetical protein VH143_25200 [Kofleriaceae bacterium]|jgi:hypothetical protein|nr:hypothetical protein [Kofleriaceae bacterium]